MGKIKHKPEAMLKVADAIEKSTVPGMKFDMCTWGEVLWDEEKNQECGTAGCIAGWTVAVLKRKNPADMNNLDVCDEARVALGLTKAEAHILFEPSLMVKVEVPNAVSVLRALAGGAKIDTYWPEKYNPERPKENSDE